MRIVLAGSGFRKTQFAGCSKNLRGEAREKSTSGGVLKSTWSEVIERNDAYEGFSAAC
jgi:hypothetical protein